ncbi:hypothetical protein [Aquimarina muelleri]|uniref:Uncharacterized protein n=1 Tax=Aquimarina muelleri TaxID=279356 RepID=A0A918JUW8_9FLAO|nr:hypothetical protein [Aquimarina muelleri]MCX2761300.1 hypothetical protein [Aquimarina muelleri]GGX12379.1 hypothetical protein GCM10007384_12710 [Aquimarina muelleri]
MNYKSKIVIIFFIIFAPIFGISQVRIGDFSHHKNRFKKLNIKDLKRFTNTQTTFVLPDFFPKSSYENILSKVWDITPYKVVYEDDFTGDDLEIDNALARFEILEVEITTKSGMRRSFSYSSIDFGVIDKIKKKKKKNVWSISRVGSIYFTPSVKIRQQIGFPGRAGKIKGNFINFRLGYLKNYLQLLNKNLKNEKPIDIYYDYAFPELKNLKNHTLYIDSNLLYGYDGFFGLEKKSPRIENLMQDYSFKYEVVESETLQEKIFNEDKDFYYLMWNQINHNKIINIVNGRTGDLVYQEHTTMSVNIKPKDFKKISSKISKLK